MNWSWSSSKAFPLYQALGERPHWSLSEIERLASSLARSMSVLGVHLEPRFLDFSVRNTFYSPRTGELVLIDFAPRPLSVPAAGAPDPVAYVLASFLAGALTSPLHRAHQRNLSGSWHLIRFCARLVREILHSTDVDLSAVRQITWRHYWHRSRGRARLRRLWFGTVGLMAFWVLFRIVLLRAQANDDHGDNRTSTHDG